MYDFRYNAIYSKFVIRLPWLRSCKHTEALRRNVLHTIRCWESKMWWDMTNMAGG